MILCENQRISGNEQGKLRVSDSIGLSRTQADFLGSALQFLENQSDVWRADGWFLGASHTVIRLVSDSQSIGLRFPIDTEVHRLPVPVSIEHAAIYTASRQSLTSRVLWSDNEKGILVYEWFEANSDACTWEPGQRGEKLDRLAGAIANLHREQCFPMRFDPKILARRFGFEFEHAARDYLLYLINFHTTRLREPPDLVFSHNDLFPRHVLEGRNGDIRLIDWEYAALNIPEWDLATIANEFALDGLEIERLIEEYSSISRIHLADFESCRIIEDALWALFAISRLNTQPERKQYFQNSLETRLSRLGFTGCSL